MLCISLCITYAYYAVLVVTAGSQPPLHAAEDFTNSPGEYRRALCQYFVCIKNRRFSVMYYGKVEISGINTSKLKVLTEEEKSELLRRTAQGDMKAREELINGNLRLVLSVIQRFAGRGESPDDLFQVGCIGLIKAIDNFSAEFGVKFSTYAVPTA